MVTSHQYVIPQDTIVTGDKSVAQEEDGINIIDTHSRCKRLASLAVEIESIELGNRC